MQVLQQERIRRLENERKDFDLEMEMALSKERTTIKELRQSLEVCIVGSKP